MIIYSSWVVRDLSSKCGCEDGTIELDFGERMAGTSFWPENNLCNPSDNWIATNTEF